MAKQLPASSAGQVDIKWVASSSSALQSLQDGSLRVHPLWRILYLEASDSKPWHPSKRQILKLDLEVRRKCSVQCVTFQRSEGE